MAAAKGKKNYCREDKISLETLSSLALIGVVRAPHQLRVS